MIRLCAILLCVAGALVLGLAPGAATQHEGQAEPARSVTGDAPLPSGAIGRLVQAAEPGAVLTIAPGVYPERLRIDKPITLVAAGSVILDGGGSGDIVEITAPDVTLRGFSLRNTGTDLDRENAAIRVLAPRCTLEGNTLDDVLFGIDLREAPDSRVIRNRIGGKALPIARRGDGLRLWRCDRARVEQNVLHDGRDAILWYSSGVAVRENEAFDCRYGLHLMFSDKVSIENNTFRGNSVGIYLMYSTGVELTGNRLVRNRGPSGYGLGLKETDRFRVRDNLIVGNRSGIYVDGSPFTQAAPGEFTGNTIACNDVGITFLPSARGNELVGNNFIDNVNQVAVAGRGTLEANRFWKDDRGNFWSDYTGFDRNADGVGDFVHESQTLFEDLMEREPALRLFLFSPAQQAIEFVGRAMPAVRPEPEFVDEVPLMRPLLLPTALAAQSPQTTGLGAVGAGLALLGAGLIAVARPEGASVGMAEESS